MMQIDLTIRHTAQAVLVADIGGTVYKLNPAIGLEEWRAVLARGVSAAVSVVGQDVYVGAGRTVYKLDTKLLRPLWTAPLPGGTVDATPQYVDLLPQVGDEVLYVTTSSGYLYALRPSDGKPLWNLNVLNLIGDTTRKTFCNLVMNNWCYLATEGGVYGVNLLTRTVGWKREDISCKCSLLVAGNLVFAPAANGVLYALDSRSGQELWQFNSGAAIHTVPVWILGNVFIGNNGGQVYGLNYLTGKPEIQVTKTAQEIQSIVADGNMLYFVGNAVRGGLYAYEVTLAQGSWSIAEKWSIPLSMGAVSSPVVVGSTLYLTAINSKAYAIDISDSAGAQRIKWQFASERPTLAAAAAVYPAAMA
jgi:outer membrane protein assembly factor BamB